MSDLERKLNILQHLWLVETLAEAPSASARCTAARSPSSAASRRSVEVAAASGCALQAIEEKTSLV